MKWRKIIGWTLALALLLIVVAGVSGYFILRSHRFEQFALRKITRAAEQATGAKTQIRSLDFSLRTLTAHLHGIVIHGTEPAGQAPLLQVDEITASFKIISVFQHKVNLTELLIAHPVAHVLVDRSGRSNLPQPAPSGTGSHTNIFTLAVRHVQLSNGEIDYNDRKIPLDADLRDLGTDVHFDFVANRYAGTISYDSGHLRYAKYAPLPHSVQATFGVTATQLSLAPATLKVGSSTALVHFDIVNFAHPNVTGDYNVRIHTPDFAAMTAGIAPTGDVVMVGKLRYPAGGEHAGEQSMLRAVATDGELSSDAFSAAASDGRIEVRRVRGRYQLADGSLRVMGIDLLSMGGSVHGDLNVQHLDATPATQVRSSFYGISLRAAQQALRRPELKQVALSGLLDGTFDGSWTGDIRKIRASSNFTVRAESESLKTVATNTVTSMPLDGVVHVTYDGIRGTVSLRDSDLHIPSTVVTADGVLGDRSNLQVQTTTRDLHELLALVSAFRPGVSSIPALSGSATVNATVRGSVNKPDISGQFAAQDLKIEGSEWRSAQASFEATPSQFEVSNGSLVSALHGGGSFSGAISLDDWSYQPSNAIRANVSMQGISVADVQHLANLHYPVSGDISASFSLSGTQLDPEGTGTLQISNGQAFGEPMRTFVVKMNADRGAVKSSLNVSSPAGSATADFSYVPATRIYTVHFNVPPVNLQRLHFVQTQNLLLYGYLSASASGTGTLDDPQLTANLQIPRLTLRDKSILGMKAELKVGEKKAEFTLNSKVMDATVQAHGRVNLEGGYYTEASIDTTVLPLDAIIAVYFPNLPQGFQGQTEFHARMAGPLKDLSQVRGDLTIPTLTAKYRSLELGTTAPIHVDYANSVITVQPAEIQGSETSLRFQGRIPLAGSVAPTFTAKGSVDLRVLQIAVPDLRSSGTVSLDVHSSGTSQLSNISGQVGLKDVVVIEPGAPLGVENLNGSLDIDNQRVRFSNLSGQVGGGTLTATGSMTYRPNVQFNLALQGKSVRIRYPSGIRTVLDGNLALTGTRDASTLSGRVLIDSLSFTPDFDLAKFADQFGSESSTPAAPGFADTVRLALAVQSEDNLSANSSQVSVAGRVNLRVGGTAAEPIITGRSDLTAGELFYRNVRYQLQRGIITFDNPNETDPVLNVSVISTVEQYNLTLNVRGPFDKLTTSYVSDPPLATADIINLLATGQTTGQSAASQSTDSIIASQTASQLTGGVQRLAGLSSLQIDPLIGGNNSNPSARIAVQQRVTKNFLFTFSTDVSQPGSEVVQGDYQINPRWSVSVARQEAGGISAEGRFHTKF
jgi:translocation and assembly module TamB